MAMEAPLAPCARDKSPALPLLCPPPAHGERRIMHYSSLQKILLVGEGDFSFSNALATAFGDGRNIIATSLDSKKMVLKKYADAASITLCNLKRLGASLFHQVDATRMAVKSEICHLIFDCVVYNFPHAGFHGSEDDKKMIKQHKRLVKLFFENAEKLLRFGGEVHVSHKVSPPYTKWKLEKQAAKCGLVLKEACDFHQSDYAGYVNRRGDGSNSAGSFPLGKCKTFIFMINPARMNPRREQPHLLGRRRVGFFHKILRHHQQAAAPPFFPPRAEQREFSGVVRFPFNLLRGTLDPRSVMGPTVLNRLSRKRRMDDEDGYGMQDWEMLEEQRFAKRGCLGLLRNDIHSGDIYSRARYQQIIPSSQLVLRPFDVGMMAPRPQFVPRPFDGGMAARPPLPGLLRNRMMYHRAGHAVRPSFH